MAAPRDPITCHVLDTTTGRPGSNISVKLFCAFHPNIIFDAKTNSDGRIPNWVLTEGSDTTEIAATGIPATVQAIMNYLISKYAALADAPHCPKGSTIWTLKFDTGSYYGAANTFFPLVELTFLVKEGEHFHVPLLLGPYSFTTYRGS